MAEHLCNFFHIVSHFWLVWSSRWVDRNPPVFVLGLLWSLFLAGSVGFSVVLVLALSDLLFRAGEAPNSPSREGWGGMHEHPRLQKDQVLQTR